MRQVFEFPKPLKQRCNQRTDRTWIDAAVCVAADLSIDRTCIETRAAADARERLPRDRVTEHRRAAVVEQHDVQLLGPLVFGPPLRTRKQRLVCRESLSGARARQELQEHVEVLEARYDLLDAHQRHVDARQARRQPDVALGLDHDEHRPRLGARRSSTPLMPTSALSEPLAQVQPGSAGQLGRVVVRSSGAGRPAPAIRSREELPRSPHGCSCGSPERRCATAASCAELDDPLAEVGLHAAMPAASSAALRSISSVAMRLRPSRRASTPRASASRRRTIAQCVTPPRRGPSARWHRQRSSDASSCSEVANAEVVQRASSLHLARAGRAQAPPNRRPRRPRRACAACPRDGRPSACARSRRAAAVSRRAAPCGRRRTSVMRDVGDGHRRPASLRRASTLGAGA